MIRNERHIVLLLTLLTGACSLNADNPAGFGYTGRGPSVVASDTLSVSGADTTWAIDLPLDKTDYLFVGQYGGFHSVALLRYTGLPAGATVAQARLTFTRRSKSATEDSLLSIQVDLQPVMSDWDSTWTGSRLGVLVTGASVGQLSLPYTANADTFGFTLPPALVQSWVDDPAAARRGIALTATNSTPFILYLDAVDAPSTRNLSKPRLRVLFTPSGGGGSQTVTLNADRDTSLMELAGTPGPGELWVGAGAPWRAMFTFPAPDIPLGATVNRAELRLTLDAGNQVGSFLTLFGAGPDGMTPWLSSPSSQFAAGTANTAVSVAASDSAATLLVTRAAADQVRRGNGIIRIIVATSAESVGIGLFRLLDATAPTSRRARLEIYYSSPPSGGSR